MNRQVVLPVGRDNYTTLDSFTGSNNRPLLAELALLISGNRNSRVVYIWGESGCGKTHLLNACCTAGRHAGYACFYVASEQHPDCSAVTKSVRADALVCIDDLDSIAEDKTAQESLLYLYEKLNLDQGVMVVSGNRPLKELGLHLEDLESRLSSGGIYRIHLLTDEEKRVALKTRAKDKGFNLDDNVVNYILSRQNRDTHSLFNFLERLDSESLKSHRRITIPFIQSLTDQ